MKKAKLYFKQVTEMAPGVLTYEIFLNGVNTHQSFVINNNTQEVHTDNMSQLWQQIVKGLSKKRKPYNIAIDVVQKSHQPVISMKHVIYNNFQGMGKVSEWKLFLNKVELDIIRFYCNDITLDGDLLESFQPRTYKYLGITDDIKSAMANGNQLRANMFSKLANKNSWV